MSIKDIDLGKIDITNALKKSECKHCANAYCRDMRVKGTCMYWVPSQFKGQKK